MNDRVPLHCLLNTLVLASTLGWARILPSPAQAEEPIVSTKQAELGVLRAVVTMQRKTDRLCADSATLQIVRSGKVERTYDLAQRQGFCVIADLGIHKLDKTDELKVVVDNFSGGAHCCFTSWIYSYDNQAKHYVLTEHAWGNAGYQIQDLNRDGVPEFRSRDDRFAYQFASYAGSFYPPRIWSYQQGRMVDVTRQHPQVIRAEAFQLWQFYQQTKEAFEGGQAALAAYMATKYLLGEAADGWQRLENAYQKLDRTQFFTDLRKFLQKTGYTAIPQRS